jgi:predicted HicB family RNase H-like nuclease
MRAEYDFTKGERGKFFRPDGELRLPIYLDSAVQDYLAEQAARKGISLNEMINLLLKQDIQIIESLK